jgi:hypothetical protein
MQLPPLLAERPRPVQVVLAVVVPVVYGAITGIPRDLGGGLREVTGPLG